MPGTLFVVATPIGNLEDITVRALRVLREVSLIAAEDTRRTAHLLARYGITTPTTSLHEHNEQQKSAALIARLQHGESIALCRTPGRRRSPIQGASDLARRSTAGSGSSRFLGRALRWRRWRSPGCQRTVSRSWVSSN